MIAFGKEAGALAGYDWPEPQKDSDHFEVVPAGMTIEMAKIAFDSNGTIFAA
jgi:hypothetical protein